MVNPTEGRIDDKNEFCLTYCKLQDCKLVSEKDQISAQVNRISTTINKGEQHRAIPPSRKIVLGSIPILGYFCRV